jgi:hypothetical protein
LEGDDGDVVARVIAFELEDVLEDDVDERGS